MVYKASPNESLWFLVEENNITGKSLLAMFRDIYHDLKSVVSAGYNTRQK